MLTALLASTVFVLGDPQWKPAPAPLLSRFAKDVSPEHPWPEYPRPTMQRERWLNLNGLWQYAIRPKSEAELKERGPLWGSWDGEILVHNIWLSLDPYMRGRMSDAKPRGSSDHAHHGRRLSAVRRSHTRTLIPRA